MPSSSIDQSLLDETEELAREVLDEARGALALALRFMDVALWRMPYESRMLKTSLAADGRRFFFDPVGVIARYRENASEVVRDYLHAILHCVFRHPFDGKHADVRAWDVACDVAVEAIALELVGLRYPSNEDDERTRMVRKLTTSCGALTASRVYRVLTPPRFGEESAFDKGARLRLLEECEGLFRRDDHSVWPRCEERTGAYIRVSDGDELIASDISQSSKGTGDLEEDSDDSQTQSSLILDGAPAQSAGGPAVEGEVQDGDRFVSSDGGEKAEPSIESMEGVQYTDPEEISWKDISKQIEMDLEAFTGKIGLDSGTFMVNLAVSNRKTYDYRDFLKRFTSLSEELKVSTDEFDYVYYTYGLKLYKNMPLIEPLEYQESNRVREFVIAIDTSASCAGGLVRQFVEKTYDILKSTSGFGRKLNVHIVQCDSDIRKDTVITSLSDIDDTFGDFKGRGFGGTDFRPVFKYVADLIDARELTDLKGLIYLTDGLGKYPEQPPGYETVFVFVNETENAQRVPPWAMKVVMDEDQILEL